MRPITELLLILEPLTEERSARLERCSASHADPQVSTVGEEKRSDTPLNQPLLFPFFGG